MHCLFRAATPDIWRDINIYFRPRNSDDSQSFPSEYTEGFQKYNKQTGQCVYSVTRGTSEAWLVQAFTSWEA